MIWIIEVPLLPNVTTFNIVVGINFSCVPIPKDLFGYWLNHIKAILNAHYFFLIYVKYNNTYSNTRINIEITLHYLTELLGKF